MTTLDIGLIALTTAVAFATSALALLIAAWLGQRTARKKKGASTLAEVDTSVAFLFDDEFLADATPAARTLLASAAGGGSDWSRLARLLRHRFPGLDLAAGSLAETGGFELTACDGSGGQLIGEWRAGLARIFLRDAGHDVSSGEAVVADQHSQAALEAELSVLRDVAGHGPTIVWRRSADGNVSWANERYFTLAEDLLGVEDAHSWPPPALFPEMDGSISDSSAAVTRVAVRPEDGRDALWFECKSVVRENEVLCFATPADDVVRAEEALREFVQTLSKTFADLPIGLAVFDRNRRLALFNPALTELTALDVDFLAARPTLFAFLDRLRDRRRIPEPRDYPSWRQRMADLEAAAAGGLVREDWSLPTGQTYRVTGRPHPDGAIAFLFEDISAEVSLTRRFRSEIELGQAVIDSLDEAIVVFSPAGTISFSNAAYAQLWGVDPSATLTETGILDATRLWQSMSRASPLWGDVRDFLAERGDRSEWSDVVDLSDGRRLTCRFQPLAGGATLVGFAESGREKVQPQGYTTADQRMRA